MKLKISQSFVVLFGVVGACALVFAGMWFQQMEVLNRVQQPIISVAPIATSSKTIDLAFGARGRISLVNKLVGDTVSAGAVIASLDNSSARSDLVGAQAALRAEKIKLAQLTAASSTAQMDVAENRVEKAKNTLLATLQAARLSTDDVIYNTTDELFANPDSSSPKLFFPASSTSEMSIESGRVEVGKRLTDLDTLLATASTSDDLESLSLSTKEDIAEVNLFLDTTALSLNALSTSSASVVPIGAWQTDLSQSRAEVVRTISSIFAADKDLVDARDFLTQAEPVYQLKAITLQQSQVAQAQTRVVYAQTALRDRSIISPITGIIIRQDAKLGQEAAAGDILVSIKPN